MAMCETCNRLPDEIAGKAVSEIPEFVNRLEEVSTDFKLWVTRFRCKKCGQIWEERYESKGHANVPLVRKLKVCER